MNDRSAGTPTTESRLRDALDAAARTIPDGAQPPGLATPVRIDRPRSRPTWVVPVAVAATVVAAVAIPVAFSRDRTAPASPACPGGQTATPEMAFDRPRSFSSPSPDAGKEARRRFDRLPLGAPPRVPFTITDESGEGYLQDGSTRVPLAAGKVTVVHERLDCRWLVSRTTLPLDQRSSKEIGVLDASGRFTRLGISAGRFGMRGLSAGMSPDATKVAYTAPGPGDTARLTVVEIDSGKEIAGTEIGSDTRILAWNPSGVWLHTGDGIDDPHRFAVWRPGSAPRPIEVAEPQLLYPFRTTERMALYWHQKAGKESCVRVVRLGANDKLQTVTQSCVPQQMSTDPTLSADGETLIQTGKSLRIPGGAVISDLNEWGYRYVWEDDQHVLAVGEVVADLIVTRCDVETGACERVYASADRYALRLIEQDPYRRLAF